MNPGSTARALFLALLLSVFPAKAQIDPLAALERSVSPFIQVDNPGMEGYEAQVDFSGSALLGLLQMTKTRSLEPPRFVERMDSGGRFTMSAANESYPEDVIREVEIQLLPFQLFFTTTRDANRKELLKLRGRAEAEMVETELFGSACVRIDLAPKSGELMTQARMLPNGDRRVSRTTMTSYWIDTSLGAIRRIVSRSESQNETSDGTPTGASETKEMTYDVDYERFAGRVVPVRIVQSIDGYDTFEQRISYRLEEDHAVFDRRDTDYFQADRLGLRATARASYESYVFGRPD